MCAFPTGGEVRCHADAFAEGAPENHAVVEVTAMQKYRLEQSIARSAACAWGRSTECHVLAVLAAVLTIASRAAPVLDRPTTRHRDATGQLAAFQRDAGTVNTCQRGSNDPALPA